MNMRVSGSPFIDRQPFETDDATAFVPAGGAWQVVERRDDAGESEQRHAGVRDLWRSHLGAILS